MKINYKALSTLIAVGAIAAIPSTAKAQYYPNSQQTQQTQQQLLQQMEQQNHQIWEGMLRSQQDSFQKQQEMINQMNQIMNQPMPLYW